MIGFGQGFQPVCGFNYGAGKYNRVKKAFWFSTRVTFIFLLFLSVTGIVFAKPLVEIFSDDPAVLEFGIPTLRFMCVSFPLNSFTVMSNMMMQTIGKGGRATVVAVSRQGLALIPIMLLLWYFCGSWGLQSSQMWADIAAFLITVPLELSVLRELDREFTDKA